MPEYDTTTPTQNRWRSPVFLVTFVPLALAWLIVVGWFTWTYFNPVANWVGGLNEALQEIVGTVLFLLLPVGLVSGLAVASVIAERVAGIQPAPPPPGETAGRHAGWKSPRKD